MLKKFSRYIERHALRQTRQQLLNMTDRQLKDVGVSRALLQEGISQWPWREDDTRSLASQPKMNEKQINQAIRELSRMSDRDLRDIGIDRGTIRHSVVNGADRRTPEIAA